MTTPPLDQILQRMLTRHPKVIDLTADRMHRLLARLGHPERDLPPIIHIAGTNGKGSTQAMIRAGLESAGQRVHAYTSPHLARFNERIRLAGVLIAEDALAALLDEAAAANGDTPITYFEITTAAAFLAFARTPADMLLLEVGLGGRFDATNVIGAPALSIITPVSYDHQQYLGDTLAEIAGEKAGILKPATPAIIAPQTPEALEVIEARAARIGAPLTIANRDYQAWTERGRLVFQDLNGLLDLPPPNLPGPHQVENAGTALAALRHVGIAPTACEAAVTRAFWPARMQRLRTGPLVTAAPGVELWLDGGHNPAGGVAIAATLAAMPPRPTHLICGMLNTKDVEGFLRPLAAQALSLRAVPVPDAQATLPPAATQAAARAVGLPAHSCPDVATALAEIATGAPNARVLICGSLYLAGSVLRTNG